MRSFIVAVKSLSDTALHSWPIIRQTKLLVTLSVNERLDKDFTAARFIPQ